MVEREAYVKMAVAHAKTTDFSVGKLELPQISNDLPEDFLDKVPSVADDVAKCSGDRFEDGEFDIEE
ncbi:hypothetical protein Bca4012_043649 [Brassica carinata]